MSVFAPLQGIYLAVFLYQQSAVTEKFARLHRVVAEAFIPNPHGYDQVNHINGDKSDNRAQNLEWCNAQQNMDHSIRTGLRDIYGDRNPSAKLTWDQVEMIRNEYVKGSKEYSTKALGRKYGVTDVMIGKIIRNECWVRRGFDPERSIHREA